MQFYWEPSFFYRVGTQKKLATGEEGLKKNVECVNRNKMPATSQGFGSRGGKAVQTRGGRVVQTRKQAQIERAPKQAEIECAQVENVSGVSNGDTSDISYTSTTIPYAPGQWVGRTNEVMKGDWDEYQKDVPVPLAGASSLPLARRGTLMVSHSPPRSEVPPGFERLAHLSKFKGDQSLILYQKGVGDRMCLLQMYKKTPRSQDSVVGDPNAIVIMHRVKKRAQYYALTPEIGATRVFKPNPRRDLPASSLLPGPVVLAALGSMSKHF